MSNKLSKKPHKHGGDEKHVGHMHKHVRLALAIAKQVIARRAYAKKSDGKLSTDGKDVKVPDAATTAFAENTLKLARAELAGKLGKRAYRTCLALPVSFSTVAGVGVDVEAITPSPAPEWGSFTSLFDEYRVLGGWYDFVSVLPGQVFTATGNLAEQALLFAFDPTDPDTLTSLAEGAQMAFHRIYAAPRVSAVSGGETGAVTNYGDGKLFRFSWRTPSLNLAQSAELFSCGKDQWQATSGGSALPYGFVKSYTAAGPSGLTARPISGILYLDLELRFRE